MNKTKINATKINATKINAKTFMNSQNIYIYASELSNLVGLNKYRKPAEVVLKIWKKNFPTDYQEIKKKLEDKKYTLALDEKREETFERISKKYVDKTQKIQAEMTECQNQNDVVKMKEVRTKMLEHCQDLEQKDKMEIEKAIYEITNTNFGTQQESKSIHIYTQLTSQPVLKLTGFHKRPLIKSEENIWYLGGKLDGLLEDKTVIEVKNRMNGLFNSVREYEKIQTFAYMFIFHSPKSQIVETYMRGKTPECGIIDVDYDTEYWQSIIQRILKFIHYFNKFMKTEKLRARLLKQGVEKFEINIFT